MNTEDRDTYDLEVTGLRKSKILVEIRSTAAAQQMSRTRRVPKARIPRFKVTDPAPVEATRGNQTLSASVGPKRELYPEETGVFIGNLDKSIQEEELSTILQRFGRVRKIIINPDKRPGVPSKYAVVWLESADQANKAVDVLYGFKLKGQELSVQRFRARPPRQPMRRS